MSRPRLRLYPASVLVAWVLAGSPAIFALNPQKVLSQYSRGVWTQAEGLPQDTIRAITQTADGYLWLGTDEGLSSFDGYDFVTFTKGDGALPSNSISALARGADGTLWIGTPGGLTRYRNHSFTTFTTRNGLPDNTVSSLVEDRHGTLWIVAGAFLSRFENGKFHNYPADELRPVRAPRVVYQDREGDIWVAGLEGLIRFADGKFVPVLGREEMQGNLINTMVRDRNGNVWLGGLKGLVQLTADGKLRISYAHGHPENLVSALWEDRDANLWAGTAGGLRRLDGSRSLATPLGNDRDMDSVRCLFEDREGNLWVGMNSGLDRFQDERFTIYGQAEGLPSDKPIAVHQDQKGEIWIGFGSGGLVAFRNGMYRKYTTKDGLASNQIQSIRGTRNGDLLISTQEGLSRMHGGHFSNFVVPEPLSRPFTFDAMEDRQGRVWLATPSGVYQLKGRTAVNVVPGGPVINDSTVVLAEDRDGSIWAGSYGVGLWHIQKDGQIRKLTVADGLSSNRIRTLYEDSEGTLWIGTWGGGLNAFRDGKFTRYGEMDGLLSDNVWHIEEDDNGALWLSTPRGISRISKRDLGEFAAHRIRALGPVNYGVADGMRTAQCPNQVGSGGTKTTDGRLWFPTSRGLAMTDPRAAVHEQAQAAPIVRFLDVSADDQRIDFSEGAAIKPGLKHIQFRFAGIHLSAPERVRYAYKLEGLDADWIPASTRRSVNYIGLAHGPYRFRVRAWVPGQAPAETSVGLEVLPHLYERPSFLWLFAISFIGAAYGIYQLHLRQIRRRFALVLAERARIAREIHDTLVQGFVGISAQLAVALRSNVNDEVARQHMMVARKMARHSLTEAKRSMVDLRASPLEGRDLVSALPVAAGLWTAGSSTPVEIQVLGSPFGLPQDLEENVLRIAQEAVTNALKHADATRVSICLEFREASLLLSIHDNGRGFEPSAVFKPADGQFGLMGIRERAERLGGLLELISQPGAGTEVRVSFSIEPTEGGRVRRRRLLNRMKTLLHPVRT